MSFFIRILLLISLIAALMWSSGCNSLKPNNLIKTGTTTAVTYAVAGPVAGVANLLVSVGVDEVLPKEKSIQEIKTKEQAVAHVIDSALLYSLYGLIAFLLITNVFTPYVTRKWVYNEAKQKYRRKEDEQ